MESKINKVKKDLRALKKSSHAIQRLIEVQGLYYKRVKALESFGGCNVSSAEKESELARRLKEEIAQSQELERKYMGAILTLDTSDKAMLLDCYINGMPYWKIAMEYGFSEEGARKHLDRLVKKIAKGL